MTMRRFMWIFVAIGIASLLMAAAGKWLLQWPDQPVGLWTGIGAGYLAGAMLFLLVPRWWREHCDEMYAMPASRRYMRAMWPIMIAYSLLLFASIWWIKRGIDSTVLRALVAVLPALPLFALMRVGLRYLRETDEFQRRIEIESIGFSAVLVSLLYFAGGLLQKAKVIHLDTAMVMIWVFPLTMLVYAIAKFLTVRRYR